MALTLTMAFSDNPRVQPLVDGTVYPARYRPQLHHGAAWRAVSAELDL